jgi:hypothetical protein
MSNNKQSSVDYLIEQLLPKALSAEQFYHIQQAKAMQQEQAQLYATFVLKCVNNNLPPITFNDWINLENNDQQ